METRCFIVPAAIAAFYSPSTPQMLVDRWHSRTLRHSWALMAVLWLFGLGSLARADSFAATGSLAIGHGEASATLLPTGKVLIVGGWQVPNSLSSAELYDPASGTWTATGSLANGRRLHTATLLPNGKVLVVGGLANENFGIVSAELYDPASGTWTTTGSPIKLRVRHTATLLPSGKVLVVGGDKAPASAELYDPASGTWTETARLGNGRNLHTATLLPNGKVLVAGGFNAASEYLASAELYDPANGTWTSTGSLGTARVIHTATLLPSGKVLVAGGYGPSVLASAELYDPASGTWTSTGSFAIARSYQTATLLPNGKVLVAGGFNASNDPITSAELYDPAGGTWTTTASLVDARYQHMATLLPNGRVLVAGGITGSGSVNSAELYESANGTWSATGDLATARRYHTATLLPDGKVLVPGEAESNFSSTSTELYDPTSGKWTATGSLGTARSGYKATLLPNGKVLVAGGYDSGGTSLASAELYDPANGTWTATGSLATSRNSHTATLLPNGKVLVSGGYQNGVTLASAELYDPASGTWTLTASLAHERQSHSATLLPNGKVLIAGGDSGTLASAELYDPASGTWTPTASLTTTRNSHTATLLPNGKVLIAGGVGQGGFLASAEIYDPASETWSATGSLTNARIDHTATLLPNGKVLVAGSGTGVRASAELYDQASGTWTATASLTAERSAHSATLLPNGKLLVAGGLSGTYSPLASAELYDVGLGFDAGWQSQISSATLNGSRQLVLSGTGFTGISEGSSGGTNNSSTAYPIVQMRCLGNEQTRILTLAPATNWSATSFTSLPIYGVPAGPATVTVFTNGIPSASAMVFLTSPYITVTGQSQYITTGDTSPSTSDGTDFGALTLLSAQATTRSFIISNTGIAPLHLTGSSTIALSGVGVADFKVITPPVATLAPGSSTTCTIAFQPKAPGQRRATITLSSEDWLIPSFTFDISGFCKLPTNLAQTITFAPSATLYVAQSPFALSASSSSGLPVTLSLVTPIPAGAALTGNSLSFTGAGTIKVQAACAASGNYDAAVSVVKSITVTANPTALTLINLNQVYDSKPKPITTLGGSGSPTISYKVGANYVGTAPSAAGSYAVKAVGATTATGTLVIAKAPLIVTPDSKFKLAGRANPALTFNYSGFVNGETSSVITTAPVLNTTATLGSPSGIYPITASGGAAANYSFVYQPASLTVASFAGSYEAMLVDGNSIPTGKLSLTIAPNATNSFTGKLYASTEATALPITGSLATNVSTDQASSAVYAVNSTGIPYVIDFTLPFSMAQTMTASVTRDNATLGSTATGRKISTATVNYLGTQTAVLEPATPAGSSVPAGSGWATATISGNGVLTLTGKLGDDTAFTAALSPDTLSDPGYRLFVQPYLAARAQSFIAGAFTLVPHPTLANRRYLAASSLTWQKAGLVADATYRSGFGPVSTVLMIDPWQAPKTTAPTVTLAQRLGLTGNSFNISHSDTGSASQGDLPTQLALSAANAVSVVIPLANKTKWKTLTFLPTTGAVTGSFEVTDQVNSKPVLRTVPFSGVLRQPADAMDPLIGDGSYVLPSLSSTEKTTGEVMFIRF